MRIYAALHSVVNAAITTTFVTLTPLTDTRIHIRKIFHRKVFPRLSLTLSLTLYLSITITLTVPLSLSFPLSISLPHTVTLAVIHMYVCVMVIIVFGESVRHFDRGFWRMHRPESRRVARECQIHSLLVHGTSRRRYSDNGSVRERACVCTCVCVCAFVRALTQQIASARVVVVVVAAAVAVAVAFVVLPPGVIRNAVVHAPPGQKRRKRARAYGEQI